MYIKPGFHEVPAGKCYLDWARELYATRKLGEADFENAIRRTLSDPSTGLGRVGRRLSSISLHELCIVASDALPLGSPGQKALAHLLTRWFVSMKLVDDYPRFIEYRAHPELRIDECVDRILGTLIKLPTLDELGGERATLETLIGVFPSLVRSLYSLHFLRSYYADRLQRAVADIAWKIASGQPIDQFEKSMFLAFNDTTDEESRGFSTYLTGKVGAERTRAGAAPSSPGTGVRVLYPVENNDQLVRDAVALLRTAVEVGPFTRFGVMYSNQRIEQLLVYWGPHVATLPLYTGHLTNFGPFEEQVVTESEAYHWTLEEQEAAIREQVREINVVSGQFAIAVPQFIMRGPNAKDSQVDYQMHLDVPEVALSLEHGFDSKATEFVAEWFSEWRERVITTDEGSAGPQALVSDLAVKHRQLGEGLTSVATCADFKLIDPTQRDEQLKKRGGQVAKTDFTARVWISANGAAPKPTEVDMKMLLSRKGSTTWRPAFTEFVWAPMRALFEPNPEAETFVATRLGLTREAAARNAVAIRVSMNAFRLQRILGFPTAFNIGRLCSALLGH